MALAQITPEEWDPLIQLVASTYSVDLPAAEELILRAIERLILEEIKRGRVRL